MYCLIVLFYVLFVRKCVLPPGDNPIAVNKYIVSYQNNRQHGDIRNYELPNTRGFISTGVFVAESKNIHFHKTS